MLTPFAKYPYDQESLLLQYQQEMLQPGRLEPYFCPSKLDPVFTAEPLGLVHQRYFLETFEPKLFLAEPEILLEPEPEPACPEST